MKNFLFKTNSFRPEIRVSSVALEDTRLAATRKSVAEPRPSTATPSKLRPALAAVEIHRALTVASRHCPTPTEKLNSENTLGK